MTVSMDDGVGVTCEPPSSEWTSRRGSDPPDESSAESGDGGAIGVSGGGAVPVSVSLHPTGHNANNDVDVDAGVYITSAPVVVVVDGLNKINNRHNA